MKKISLIAVLVIAMLFSLTGCGKTDYEMYSDAYKNAEEMKGIDAEGSVKLVINSVDGTTNMNLPIDFALKVDDVNNKNAKMLITYSMPFMGMNTQSSVYVADGYRYTATKTSIEGEEFEQKIKEAVDESDSDFPELKEGAKINLDLFVEEDFKNASKESVDGGNKYTITKTSDEVKAYAEKIMSDIIDAMDKTDAEKEESKNEMKESFDEMTFGGMTVTFVIKDGYFTEFGVVMNGLVINSSEISTDDLALNELLKIDIEVNVKFNNPGKDVTVTAPSDLDEYEEFDFDFDFDY